MLLEVLSPWRNGAPETKLHAGNVQGVLLAVLHDDVQDPVLVFRRFPVLADEAPLEGLYGECDFADIRGQL